MPSGPGGADRIRTDDPLLAKQVLYQLSYRPKKNVLFPATTYSGPFTFPSTALETAPNWSVLKLRRTRGQLKEVQMTRPEGASDTLPYSTALSPSSHRSR
jgi:hypothetical protein